MSEEIDVDLLFKQNNEALDTLIPLLEEVEKLRESIAKAIGQLQGTEDS
jgi:hypothetical protein